MNDLIPNSVTEICISFQDLDNVSLPNLHQGLTVEMLSQFNERMKYGKMFKFKCVDNYLVGKFYKHTDKFKVINQFFHAIHNVSMKFVNRSRSELNKINVLALFNSVKEIKINEDKTRIQVCF